MKQFILGFMTLAFAPLLYAHEGHDHGPKGGATHGGLVKESKNMLLEFVTHGSDIQIYPKTLKGDPIDTENLKLTATMKAPDKKPVALAFAAKGDHFMGKITGPKSYRHEVTVNIPYQGEKNTFSIQVETEE